jgi:hypothetical protein
MKMMTFAIGGLFCMSAFIVYFVAHRYRLRVMRRTAGRPGAVTYTDTWLNTRYFALRRKLRYWAMAGDDDELKHSAAAALKFGDIFLALFAVSMVVMFLGALFQK